MNLADWDILLLNSSGGKDSQTTLDVVARMAAEQGVSDRLVVVHADLGRVEWKGTKELAGEQAAHYGVPFIVAPTRPQGDLLEQVEKRGMWPSSQARYCTSDQKRGQIRKIITRLVQEKRDLRERLGLPTRKVRVLSIMGLRAEESPARAKKAELSRDAPASNGKREVWVWLPILDMLETEVWARIRATGVRHHVAYDLGMPRLSCAFCVFASKDALLIAGKHNPELLAEYVRVEEKIGHTFRQELPIAVIKRELDTGRTCPTAANGWAA